MSGDSSPPVIGRPQGEKPGDNNTVFTEDNDHAAGAGWHQAQVEKQAIPGVHLEDEYEESSGEGPAAVDAGREGEGGGGGSGGVLDRVMSRVSTKSSWNPGPPPNGGVKAWTAGE